MQQLDNFKTMFQCVWTNMARFVSNKIIAQTAWNSFFLKISMCEISLAKTYEKWDNILFPLIKHGRPRERIINTRGNHFLNKHIPVKGKQTQPKTTSVGRNYTWHLVMVYLFWGSARLNWAASSLPCYDKLECRIYHVKSDIPSKAFSQISNPIQGKSFQWFDGIYALKGHQI
jgi:hypothetical protein